MKTAFVINEFNDCDNLSSMICICSNRDKAEIALKILQSNNKNPNFVYYDYVEVNLDFIPIYL